MRASAKTKPTRKDAAMSQKTLHAMKLTAVYESLTATICQFQQTHPDVVDTIALPMRDLENIVNEANEHRDTPAPAPHKHSKTP